MPGCCGDTAMKSLSLPVRGTNIWCVIRLAYIVIGIVDGGATHRGNDHKCDADIASTQLYYTLGREESLRSARLAAAALLVP